MNFIYNFASNNLYNMFSYPLHFNMEKKLVYKYIQLQVYIKMVFILSVLVPVLPNGTFGNIG